MNYLRQDFKKYLIDYIKRNSRASYREILNEVNAFEKTDAFNDAYKKWLTLNSKPELRRKGPEHILASI